MIRKQVIEASPAVIDTSTARGGRLVSRDRQLMCVWGVLLSATIRYRQDRRQHPPDHQGQGQRVIPAPEATNPVRAPLGR